MRGLQAKLQGRRILRAEIRRPDLRWPFPPGLAARLAGAEVLGFRRRAKYILMRLSGGDSVLIHLGMSGRMLIEPAGRNDPGPLHEHVMLETDPGDDGGWRIGFVDPRRFGSVDLLRTDAEDAHRLLAGLGPEPLDDDFSPASLSAALAGKRTPIKAALLDQKIVAGLGNIYVCEALFRAGISPQRLAHTIPGARAGAAGAGDQGHLARGDRRRRIKPARLRPAGWRARLFPARLEGLRPGRGGLPALRLLSGDQAYRAVRPQHVLLRPRPAVRLDPSLPQG